MTNTSITDILETISAPSLKSANYGANIQTQFNNIDENFKKIVGTDFLRGLQGDSIILKELDFSENAKWEESIYLKFVTISGNKFIKLTPAILRKAIINAIEYNVKTGLDISQYNSAFATIPEDGNKYDITPVGYSESLDYNSKITLICAIDEETKNQSDDSVGVRYIVSSLPYIFYDARFSKIKYEILSDYNDIIDTSCVIYFDPNKFSIGEDWGKNEEIYNYTDDELKGLTEHCLCAITTFPTMYYDEDTLYDGSTDSYGNQMGTFCWKINGHKTGIPANGPRGPKGNSGQGYVVKVANHHSNKFGPLGRKLYPVISTMVNVGTNEMPDVRFVKIDDIINGKDEYGNKLYDNVDLTDGSLTLAFKTVNDNIIRDKIESDKYSTYFITINAPGKEFEKDWKKNNWEFEWKYTFNDGTDASDFVTNTLKPAIGSESRQYTLQKSCSDNINVVVYPKNTVYDESLNYNEDAEGYTNDSEIISKVIGVKLSEYSFSIPHMNDEDIKNGDNIISFNFGQNEIRKISPEVRYEVRITKGGSDYIGNLEWTFRYLNPDNNSYDEIKKGPDDSSLITVIYHPKNKKYRIISHLDHDIVASAVPTDYKDKIDEITWNLTQREGGLSVVHELPPADLVDYIKTDYTSKDSFVDKCWVSPLIQYTYKDTTGKTQYEYYVECEDYNSIMNTFEAHAMINYMLSIGKAAFNPGIILPITNDQSISYDGYEEVLPGHLMYTIGSSLNKRSHMVIAPLDNVLVPFNENKKPYSNTDNSLSIWHNDVYIGKHSVEGIENIEGYKNNLTVAGLTRSYGFESQGYTRLLKNNYIPSINTGILDDKDNPNFTIDSIGRATFKDLLINKTSEFGGNTIFKSTTNFNKKSVFDDSVDINDTLTLSLKYNEDADGYGETKETPTQYALQVLSPAKFDANVDINSDVSISGGTLMKGYLFASKGLGVSGGMALSGDLVVHGNFSIQDNIKDNITNETKTVSLLDVNGLGIQAPSLNAELSEITTNRYYSPMNPCAVNMFYGYTSIRDVASNVLSGETAKPGCLAVENELMVGNDILVSIYNPRRTSEENKKNFPGTMASCTRITGHKSVEDIIDSNFGGNVDYFEKHSEYDNPGPHYHLHWQNPIACKNFYCNNGFIISTGPVPNTGTEEEIEKNISKSSYVGIYIDNTSDETKGAGPILKVCTKGQVEKVYISDIVKAIKYLKSENLI